MADKKISALTGASTPLAGTEVLPIVQSGSTVKVSVANLTTGRDVSVKDLAVTGSYTQGNTAITIGTNQLVKDTNGWFAFGTATTRAARVLIENEGAAGNPQIMLVDSNSSGLQSELRFDNGDVIFDYWDGGVIGRTEKLRINADDNVKVSRGNLVIGTAAKGIDFSANTGTAGMTSELLTWYEEGTFTPTIVDGGFSSLSTIRAKYTRIGRCVYIVLDAQLVGTGNGNVFKIGGLPFTVSTNGWAGSSFFADNINTANYNLSGLFASATTEVWTVINVSGTSRSGIGTDYSAGGINFTGFYFV
jgi:hypothetical protein